MTTTVHDPHATLDLTPTPTPSPYRWASWQLHLDTWSVGAADRVLQNVVRPVVNGLDKPWFFLRYWQGGPHVRLRVADLDPDARRAVDQRLRDLLPAAARRRPDESAVEGEVFAAAAQRHASVESGTNRIPQPLRAAGVHEGSYEPELARYGGTAVIGASEELFTVSSRLVVGMLPQLSTHAQRASVALAMTDAALQRLGDDTDRALFAQLGRTAWHDLALGYGYLEAALGQIVASATSIPPATWRTLPQVEAWLEGVDSLLEILVQNQVPAPGRVVASHVHMLHNRLGLSTIDEYSAFARLAATYPMASRVSS